MKFRRSEPNATYAVWRLVSENKVWELGLTDYAHGMRLRMGRCGRPPSVLDFCLGRDGAIFLPVVSAVLGRLAGVSESATSREIDDVFPWAGSRPDLSIHLEALLAGEGSDEKVTTPRDCGVAHGEAA